MIIPQAKDRSFIGHGRMLIIALMLAFGLAFIAEPAQAAIRYVAPGGLNVGGCLNQNTPCGKVGDALSNAASGDEIRIAAGTYTEPQLVINKPLTIVGGFDPSGATGWTTTNYNLTPTILDGQNTDRVVYLMSGATNSVLEYLTIRNGNASNNTFVANFGGGIVVHGATGVVFRGLTIRDNVASTLNSLSSGGGVAMIGESSLTIERSLIIANATTDMGGGIGLRVISGTTASITIRSSVIAHNSAESGGALATSGTGRSLVQIFHTTFGNNNVGSADEAIYMAGGHINDANSFNVSYSLLTGNNTALRSTLTQTPSILTTGLIVDTNVTNGWVGTLPVLNSPLQRPLPFVNAAAGDYHLTATSPAIDIAGNTNRIDLEGRQRVNSANCTPFTLCPMGKGDDYGAYEYIYTAPSIRYVSEAEGDKSSNNCLNSSFPCGTLDDATAYALGGDELRVAQGLYQGGDTICANGAVICIRQGITVTGGYPVGNWTTPSADPALTIIDGTNIRRGIQVDYNVVDGSALIQNVTVRNGYAMGNGAGIAIGNQNIGPAQNLTIRNCVVENSTVEGDGVGGGIFAIDPRRLIVENCVLRGNVVTDGRGGGIGITDDNGDATYTLTKLTVYNNRAERPDDQSANGGRGGGVFLEGFGKLQQSEVYSNVATFSGGGVSIGSNGANVSIDRLYIHDNEAAVGGGFSIFLTGGGTVQNTLIVRNKATSAVPVTGQMVEVHGGNAVHTPEGGSPGNPLRLINVTIADNTGAVPEAVKIEGLADTNVTRVNRFINVLISGNQVGIKSDGLGVAELGKVLITNDITTKLEGFAPERLTGTPISGTVGYVGNGDYRLVPGADGVDDGDMVLGNNFDLDGVPRPQGKDYDIGAYETAATKQSQTITFAAIADRELGESPFTVSPTASSGLAVQLTSQTPAICTVNGFTVTLLAEGICTLRASQPGNAAFEAAPNVNRTFGVGVEAPPPPPDEVTLHMPMLGK